MPKAKIILKQIGQIEQLGKNLKRSAWISIVESLLLIMLGALLVAMPEISLIVITYIASVFFIVRGLYQVINYFISKEYKNFFNNNLLWGVISIIIGVALFLAGDEVTNIFRIIIGIWIIYSSLVNINTAIKLSNAKIKNWFIVLILALLVLVFGCTILVTKGATIVFIGWFLLVGGISGIVSNILFISNIDDITKSLSE